MLFGLIPPNSERKSWVYTWKSTLMVDGIASLSWECCSTGIDKMNSYAIRGWGLGEFMKCFIQDHWRDSGETRA